MLSIKQVTYIHNLKKDDAETLSGLKLLHRGKVRDIYEVDADVLLLVASDRISAYDVVHKTVCHILLSWSHFTVLEPYNIPHFITSSSKVREKLSLW